MKINNIYNIDCNKGMNKMIKDNQKVDLIIADPPYVISKKSQFHTMKDRKNPRNGTDFGEWDKEFNNKPWIKKSFELFVKKRWLRTIEKETDKYNKIKNTLLQQQYVVNSLLEEYKKMYGENLRAQSEKGGDS